MPEATSSLTSQGIVDHDWKKIDVQHRIEKHHFELLLNRPRLSSCFSTDQLSEIILSSAARSSSVGNTVSPMTREAFLRAAMTFFGR